MGVHEPIVLRIIVGAAASGDRLSHQLVNLRLAFTGQRDENFRAPGRIADFFRREFLELGVREQHDVDVRAHNHASGCFISELRIERKAQALEEVHRLAEVLDRQINEYLRSHFLVCLGSVESLCESWCGTGKARSLRLAPYPCLLFDDKGKDESTEIFWTSSLL